jgi:hypothetical protein
LRTGAGDVPMAALQGPHSAASGRRVAITHLVVTLLGIGILIRDARPFSGPVAQSLPNTGGWQLLATSAVIVGALGGLLEGLALRFPHGLLAMAALVGASVPALWLPLLALGRWYRDQKGDLIETGQLVAGLVGWLMFTVVIAAVAAASAVAGRRRAPHDS